MLTGWQKCTNMIKLGIKNVNPTHNLACYEVEVERLSDIQFVDGNMYFRPKLSSCDNKTVEEQLTEIANSLTGEYGIPAYVPTYDETVCIWVNWRWCRIIIENVDESCPF